MQTRQLPCLRLVTQSVGNYGSPFGGCFFVLLTRCQVINHYLIQMKEKLMKKLLTAAMLLVAPATFAIDVSNTTAWTCAQPAFFGVSNLGYCGVTINSGTTAATLGAISVVPSKNIFVSVRADQAAVAGLVTPTLNLSLGGVQVGSLSVSSSLAGNVVNLGAVPYFDAVTISVSTPAVISATNTLRLTVIENR